MVELRFVDAATEEHFADMSLIHALGWRTTYPDAVPAEFMQREITDDRWVKMFRENYKAGTPHGILLYADGRPVCCAVYGPARTDAGLQAGTVCKFNNAGYEGWGEVISFYSHPDEKGKGYGSVLMEEVLRRLKLEGFPSCYVYVLRENDGARRFYSRHGFSWDGTHEEIPFPPDALCIDLRYTRKL